MSNPSTAPVVVLSGHRSGSSAVMGLLVKAGLHVGETLPPRLDNPLGFFESVEIVNINRQLLAQMDRDWTCPPNRLDPSIIDTGVLEETVERLRLDSDGPWGVKDPRMLFTLDAWLRVIPSVQILGVFRPTAAIARSLMRRDLFTFEAAHAIASLYNDRLANLHQELQFPIIQFNEDEERLQGRLRRVADQLDLHWNDDRASEFFRTDMVHHEESSDLPGADHYLDEAGRRSADLQPVSSADVLRALGRVHSSSTSEISIHLGQSYLDRRSRGWELLIGSRSEVGPVLELVPDDGRQLTIPPEIDPSHYAKCLVNDVEPSRFTEPFTHVLATDALDVVHPQQLDRFVDNIAEISDQDAVVLLSGRIVDEPQPSQFFDQQLGLTFYQDRAPYWHDRDLLERVFRSTNWHLAGWSTGSRGSNRSFLVLAKSAVRADPKIMAPGEMRQELVRITDALAQSEKSQNDLRNERNRLSHNEERLTNQLLDAQTKASQFRQDAVQLRDEVSELKRQVEKERVDSEQQIEDMRGELGQALDKSRELEQARAESDRQRIELQRDLKRLRSRRSVRLALTFAALFRPLFRWRRAQAKKTVDPNVRQKEAKDSDESPSDTRSSTTAGAGLVVSTPAKLMDIPLQPDEQFDDSPEQLTVIVPVFNAHDEVTHCLKALSRNTTYPAKLLLIDDASTDPAIQALLQHFASNHANTQVLTNERNLGFVATVNRGFEESTGDVVIVNSDVEVVPGWLNRLVAAARAVPDAGTVTPLSNNAGAFSAPRSGEMSETPSVLTKDEIGRLVARSSRRLRPTTPTGNGFCMFIRRQALLDVGPFDEEAFPRGYGEENDFCMKATKKGWRHVVDDSTYVFHTRSASFGDEKIQLADAARRTINDRYPEYTDLVRSFVRSSDMMEARQTVADSFEDISSDDHLHPRALTVLHGAGGGTPATTMDLMHAISPRFETLRLASDSRNLTLGSLGPEGNLITRTSWHLPAPIYVTDISRPEYRSVVAQVLQEEDIEVVHIRHLIGHTFDLPWVAQVHGVPVILSFHDFYYVCPTVHLLDENNRFCGGRCTPGQGKCLIPTPWLVKNMPHLKHSWVYRWQQHVREMFRNIDAFVVASPSTAEVYLSVYPEIENRLHVIEHGRDLQDASRIGATKPPPHGPVRILVPGHIAIHKGTELIRQIKETDTDDRLEFHFAGRLNPSLDDVGVQHGQYGREELPDLIRQIRPSLVGLFSITAETFSHTLTEAWHSGIPVVATDLGAFKDRIDRHGGGILVDPTDPDTAYKQIRAVVDDQRAFAELTDQVPIRASRSATEMAFDYEVLYKSATEQKRAFRKVRARDRPIRLGLFVPGRGGRYPGSVHVRTLRRYQDPSIEHGVAPILLDPFRFMDDDAIEIDVALVQRTAVPPEATARFLDTLQKRRIQLVFDVDDDLINMTTDHPDFEIFVPWRQSLEELARAASLITVSTIPLQQRMQHFGQRVVVVPNQLDRHLWLAPQMNSRRAPSHSRSMRLLYFGSMTHAKDLDLLKPLLKSSNDSLSLTIVGGAPLGSLDWCQHVHPPSDKRNYPDFVRWIKSFAEDFDAFVGPLADHPFNKSKSDLKFLEATALGLPFVCSNLEPYSTVINGETGIVVGPEPHDWLEAIRTLREDASLGNRIAQTALEYVGNHRLLDQHSDQLLGLLHSVASNEWAIA